jgi:hypothetical protein
MACIEIAVIAVMTVMTAIKTAINFHATAADDSTAKALQQQLCFF